MIRRYADKINIHDHPIQTIKYSELCKPLRDIYIYVVRQIKLNILFQNCQ